MRGCIPSPHLADDEKGSRLDDLVVDEEPEALDGGEVGGGGGGVGLGVRVRGAQVVGGRRGGVGAEVGDKLGRVAGEVGVVDREGAVVVPRFLRSPTEVLIGEEGLFQGEHEEEELEIQGII